MPEHFPNSNSSGRIDENETSDTPLTFVERLTLEGIDPKTGLVERDCSGWDFQDADIDGWDLSHADLRGADLRTVRNIGMALWNDTRLEGALLPEGIDIEDLEKIP